MTTTTTTTTTLKILSGGAAQAVVTGLQPGFEARHGCVLAPTFGAVGAMRDKLLAGESCDLLVLSAALIAELAREGRAVAGSERELGPVATGVAVPEGVPPIDIGTADALARALSGARALYVPDLAKSSAGIHIAGMLRALGLERTLAGRIREFPNGAAAMRAMADDGAEGAVGCTQATEILYTPGARLVGELPAEHALRTVYTAAVCAQARSPEPAAALADLLADGSSLALRRRCGFAV